MALLFLISIFFNFRLYFQYEIFISKKKNRTEKTTKEQLHLFLISFKMIPLNFQLISHKIGLW